MVRTIRGARSYNSAQKWELYLISTGAWELSATRIVANAFRKDFQFGFKRKIVMKSCLALLRIDFSWMMVMTAGFIYQSARQHVVSRNDRTAHISYKNHKNVKLATAKGLKWWSKADLYLCFSCILSYHPLLKFWTFASFIH